LLRKQQKTLGATILPHPVVIDIFKFSHIMLVMCIKYLAYHFV